MKRPLIWVGALLLGGVAVWQAGQLVQDPPSLSMALPPADKPQLSPTRPLAAALSDPNSVTPMAERIAVLGILNKRNGVSRDLALKPGQAVRIGDLVVRLRACEETDPWEPEKWTGAFVQVITRETGTRWRKIFSGWMYKESPSLNVVEHPVYDVWVKACKMRHPDVGPDTVVVREEASGRSSAASNASISPEAEALPADVDSAAPSLPE